MSEFRAIIVLLLVAHAGLAAATTPSHPCAYKLDAAERLACYDAAFPPAMDEASRAAAQEALRRQAVEEFGLSGVQQRERAPEHERAARPDRIEASVARVGMRASGERMLTLDNDQVWMLTEGGGKGHLQAGDKVVIRRAAMGSFLLATPDGIWLRAKRIL